VEKTSALKRGLAAFKGSTAADALDQEVKGLVDILKTAEEDLQRLFKEQDILRGGKVTDDQIREARKRSIRSKSATGKSFEALGDLNESGSFLGVASSRTDRLDVNRKPEDVQAAQNRGIRRASEHRAEVRVFNEELKSELELGDDIDLGAIKELAEAFRDAITATKISEADERAGGRFKADDEREETTKKLNTLIQDLDISLKNNQTTFKLESQRKEQAERAATVESRITESSETAGGARRGLTVAKERQASFQRIEAIRREGEGIEEQKNLKAANKKLADERLKAAKALERENAAAIKTAQSELKGSGKIIGATAGGITSPTGKGQSVIDTIATAFKDGVVTTAESPALKNAIKALNTSNAAKNNETLKALQTMIKENQAMAKKVRELTKNAKTRKD
jgi:hypothetical protein